jgi:hypothetical protein
MNGASATGKWADQQVHEGAGAALDRAISQGPQRLVVTREACPVGIGITLRIAVDNPLRVDNIGVVFYQRAVAISGKDVCNRWLKCAIQYSWRIVKTDSDLA